MAKTEKTRYTDKELEEFKVLIEEKIVKAQEQLQFYKDQLKERADNPEAKMKGLDDSLGSVETENLIILSSRQQKLIQHLQNALLRIQNKVYGICRETGKLISKERLRAVPHATLSIDAKQSSGRR